MPQLTLTSVAELPFVLAMGLAIGVLAVAFNRFVCTTAVRTQRWPFLLRMLLAGAVAGLCALPAPQIMGVGYDSIAAALLGNLPAVTLVAIVVFKLLATSASIGLGVPAGLIGPILLIGAAAGGASGELGAMLAPTGAVSSTGFYALIGLGAMMAGTLHAPLAALTAMLELTGNPHIIWPGMLAVIAAYGTSRVAFGQQPMFLALLHARGLDYRNDPITQSLRRVGVAAVMDTAVAALPRVAPRAGIEAALDGAPRWILVLGDQAPASAAARRGSCTRESRGRRSERAGPARIARDANGGRRDRRAVNAAGGARRHGCRRGRCALHRARARRCVRALRHRHARRDRTRLRLSAFRSRPSEDGRTPEPADSIAGTQR